MTKTLLIDLDNTLLRNENSVFIPALVRAFSQYSAELIDPDESPGMFLLGTQAMIENRRPDRILFEVLQEDLSDRSGLAKNILVEQVTSFYRDVFPSLEKLTEPVPEAQTFIEEANERGYILALSTNPLYPQIAIEERLNWAGLPRDKFEPVVITSFDNFHFTKPSPAYYAEILAQMNWPGGEVVIVGDDPALDIEPAKQFGVRAYQVNLNRGHPETAEAADRYGSGGLMDLFEWLDRTNGNETVSEFNTPAALEAVLRSTPAALDTLLRSARDLLFDYRIDEKEWNITEVICHLRDVEREVRLPRVRHVLREENPLITGKNTDEWADERGYCFQNPHLAFREFLDCRMETLSLIEKLDPEDWNRPARHTIFGPTDLRELVSIAAAHDRIHIHQIGHLRQDFSRN